MIIWFSLLPVLHGCKVFEQFLNNATIKPKKKKNLHSGGKAASRQTPRVLGTERNSEAKMLFRSLKISSEFPPEKLRKEAWLNCWLPGKHECGRLFQAFTCCQGSTGLLPFLSCQQAEVAFATHRAN